MSNSPPLVSVSEQTNLDNTFEEDLEIAASLGIAGIGIIESKLGPDDGRNLEALQGSEVKASVCLPACPSPLPSFPRNIRPGTEDPQERVQLLAQGVRRLAAFGPSTILVSTGSDRGRDPREARLVVVAGLRQAAQVAGEMGLDLSLEPHRDDTGYDASIVRTIGETLDLIDEVGAPNVGICYDTYHLWDTEDVLADTERYAGRIFGVHVSDWRDPPRGLADRLIPGEGSIDLPALFGALERGGFDRWFDIEVVSDDGRWGTALEDSLYKVPPDELYRRSIEGFHHCWEARR